MTIQPQMLIGSRRVLGSRGTLRAIDPSTGAELDPTFGLGGDAEADAAAQLAARAFPAYSATSPEHRAAFLELAATKIEQLGDELLERAHAETGLTITRLASERARTTNQLRLFGRLLRNGLTSGVRIDTAQPDRTPLPRPDIRQHRVPLGPVAVFGSSNFPLAFSNAGGDTASALAAGCPVVVKVHNAHPGTAMLVAGAVVAAAQESGLPDGVYSSVIGAGNEIGAALVAHPDIAAVGFTGSRSGGLALVDIARRRTVPIPVYAEMSSINPVIVFRSRATGDLAGAFLESLTLGSGQFCTNPGLVFVPRGAEGDAFVDAVARGIADLLGQTMLTPGICDAFARGVAALSALPGVRAVGSGVAGDGANAPAPAVFETGADAFAAEPRMQNEIFGAAALLVRHDDESQLRAALTSLEGQLTVSVHADRGDDDAVRGLLPLLERKAGRIVYNGWPTGVEACDAMVHGGPYPSTSDGRSTSVGTLAIERFLRPVAYQGLPDDLLPPAVADANPWRQVRLIDGEIEGLER